MKLYRAVVVIHYLLTDVEASIEFVIVFIIDHIFAVVLLALLLRCIIRVVFKDLFIKHALQSGLDFWANSPSFINDLHYEQLLEHIVCCYDHYWLASAGNHRIINEVDQYLL